MSLLQVLKEQHVVDLAVYRSAHTSKWNRRLHYVLIPLEVAAFLWLLTTLLFGLSCYFFSTKTAKNNSKSNNVKNKQTKEQEQQATQDDNSQFLVSMVTAAAWTLGLLSCAVASEPYLGLAVLVMHVFLGQLCQLGVPLLGLYKSFILGVAVWTFSWLVQIGVGHYWIEGTPPNLFNPNDKVTLLSAATSIVLAWEC